MNFSKLIKIIALFVCTSINASAAPIYGIGISVKYSIEHCSKDYPLEIRVKNNTFKSLMHLRFDVIAKAPGYSSEKYRKSMYSDKIVKRFEAEVLCFSVERYEESRIFGSKLIESPDLNGLDISTEINYTYFEW